MMTETNKLPKDMVPEGHITGTMIDGAFKIIPLTGEIFWMRSRGGKLVGDRAGCVKKGDNSSGGGYRVIWIGARGTRSSYRAHHLVWAWVTGCWPRNEIDHINGERDDNRFENLREATVAQNRTNKNMQSNNKSGYKWVHWDKERKMWAAEIAQPNYRQLGTRKRWHHSFHSSPEEAYEVACKVAKELHGKFFNSGRKK